MCRGSGGSLTMHGNLKKEAVDGTLVTDRALMNVTEYTVKRVPADDGPGWRGESVHTTVHILVRAPHIPSSAQ